MRMGTKGKGAAGAGNELVAVPLGTARRAGRQRRKGLIALEHLAQPGPTAQTTQAGIGGDCVVLGCGIPGELAGRAGLPLPLL